MDFQTISRATVLLFFFFLNTKMIYLFVCVFLYAHIYSLYKTSGYFALLLFLQNNFTAGEGGNQKAKSIFPFTENISLGLCEM